jgi:hypothetical protein
LANVRIDPRGFDKLAQSREITDAVRDAAEAVAENVKAQGHRVEGIPGDVDLPVKVSMFETDRAHAVVSLAHPSGEAVQAKHGALSKAATQTGLDFRSDG